MKKTTTNLPIKFGCAYSHSSGVPQLLATVLASFMLEDMSHCYSEESFLEQLLLKRYKSTENR